MRPTLVSSAPLLLALLAPTTLSGQKTRKPTRSAPALVLVENVWDKKDGVCRTRRLVRYRLRGGRISEKEVVLSREQRFFGHFGRHRLVGDRFVVTQYGGVIDLETKEVVHDEMLGKLVRCDEKSVVYSVNNVHRERGLFAFNLATRKRTKLPATHIFALPGKPSPNGMRTAEVDTLGQLRVYAPGEPPRTLAKGFGFRLSMFSSGSGTGAALHWLDDRTILTQHANDQLVTVDLKGDVQPFVTVDGATPPISPPTLYRDASDRLIYQCERFWIVDPKERTATQTSWLALGHGFEAATDVRSNEIRTIRENGKEIGRWICSPWQAVTAPGRLAIPFSKSKKSRSSENGIKIWDSTELAWKTIRVSVNTLIGWTGSRRVRTESK